MVPNVHPTPEPPLWIDHVVVAVADVEVVAQLFASRHGLGSYGVATPPGLTGRIVPCGSGYLHLLAVGDASAATAHPLGAAAEGAIRDGRPLLSWAVATDWMGPVVRRTGAELTFDEISATNGPPLRRQVVGADQALGGELPAIVCWQHAEQGRHPQHQPVGHRVDPVGITCIDLAADPVRLRDWLGRALDDLPIRIRPGRPGLHGVTVGTASGEVLVDACSLDGHRRHAPVPTPAPT